MPRRNRARSGFSYRRRVAPAEPEQKSRGPNYEGLAADLVRAGICSPRILSGKRTPERFTDLRRGPTQDFPANPTPGPTEGVR